MAVRIPFIAAIVMVACAEIASLLTSGCAPNIDDTVQHTKSVSIDVVCGRASDCSRATVPFGYDSYVFNADGAISAERSAFGERPPIFESRTEFRALVGRLLRTTPFVFARRARPRSYATAPASWIVTLVLDDGRYRSIDVPQPERGRRPASGDALLQSWIIDTEAGAAKRLAVARARMTARLGDVGNLASVEFDANGCFGDCPAYVVRFYPSGAATLDGADFPGSPVHVHRATVPFNRINDLLVSVSFAHLERSYPIHGSTCSARHSRYVTAMASDTTSKRRMKHHGPRNLTHSSHASISWSSTHDGRLRSRRGEAASTPDPDSPLARRDLVSRRS